jgi:hypothetical protein
MCSEVSAIFLAVAGDFFFDGSHLEISTDVIIPTYHGASTIMRRAFD